MSAPTTTPTQPLIDPIDLIHRAYKAGELNDLELVAFQNSYMPKCSFDNNPSVIRDDRLFLCEQCAVKRMPSILQRETDRRTAA